MKTSEHIDELAAALMVVQNTVGNLPKTAKGYGYGYTPLDAVTDALRKPLADNGLSYVQMPTSPPDTDTQSVALVTRLMHVSGQWLEDTAVIPLTDLSGQKSDAQRYGATLTYARRYALTAMFGIAADEDTDARPTPGNNRPPAKAPKPAEKAKRPLTAESLKSVMAKKTANDTGKPPSDKQLTYARSSMAAITTGDERHTISQYLFGKKSSKDWTAAECSAIIDWVNYKEVDGDWIYDEDARREAQRIIRADAIEKGQSELFPD